MSKIIDRIAKLISVKTFITMLIVGVFCWLALRGTIQPSSVDTITMAVIAYYFGTQHEKQNKE